MNLKEHSSHWNEQWLLWAKDFIVSSRFLALPDFNKQQIFIEIGNLDEQGITVSAITAYLKSCPKQSSAMAAAIFALGKLGRIALPSANVLASILNQALIPPVLFNTVWALNQIGEIPRSAVKDLIKKLNDRYQYVEMRGSNVQNEALKALVRMGPAILPDLITALKDENTKDQVRSIILQMKTIETKSIFIRHLAQNGHDAEKTSHMVGLLEEIDGCHIYSILTRMIRDEDEPWGKKMYAIRALGKLKPAGKKVVPFFLKIAQDEKEVLEVREAAIGVLENYHAEMLPIFSGLKPYLYDHPLSFAISELLEQFAPSATPEPVEIGV